MKVMIQAPWESKPHGPYRTDMTDSDDEYIWVHIDGKLHEVPCGWCTEVQEPKFPEGFPVVRKDTSPEHIVYWDSNILYTEDYTWPRAPWESAPEGARQWIVTEDAACNWGWDGGYAVGDQFCGTEIVHVEERE